MWKGTDDFEEWHPGVPGHVDEVEADVLAEQHEDYRELAGLDVKVPTIFLNRDYAPLKSTKPLVHGNSRLAGSTKHAIGPR